MIKKKNTFGGASFDYTSENGNCVASGEYRIENGQIVSISINGQLTKEEKAYRFSAGIDINGNVNISGVSFVVIADVAAEVAAIIAAIEENVNPSEPANEE